MTVSLSATAELSFFEKLGASLYELFLKNDTYYMNLELGASDYKHIMITVIAVCIGIIIALIATVFNKRVLGGLVRALIAAEALSPDCAKTLEELGASQSLLLRRAVQKNVNLRRVLRSVGEEAFLADQEQKRQEHEAKRETDRHVGRFRELPYRHKPDSDRYYVPEELKEMATAKFNAKGASAVSLTLLIFLVCVIFVLIANFLPAILQLADNVVGMLKQG